MILNVCYVKCDKCGALFETVVTDEEEARKEARVAGFKLIEGRDLCQTCWETPEQRRQRGVCACGMMFAIYTKCNVCGETNPFYDQEYDEEETKEFVMTEPAIEIQKMRDEPICPWLPAATLLVGGSSSQCNACGVNALPHEEEHTGLGGYYKEHQRGCGIRWTHVTSMYMGKYPADTVRKIRPDLEFISIVPEDNEL